MSWRAVRSAAAVQAVECVHDHTASFQSGSIPLDPGTPVSSRDRDFRPTRRRGFDDDNFETPRRGFGSTPGSCAQRFEAPAGSPVQAVVKWYNPDKGFGFVQLADGSGDAFLHASVVERSGHGSVPPGATLEVRAGPGPKGPQGFRAWLQAQDEHLESCDCAWTPELGTVSRNHRVISEIRWACKSSDRCFRYIHWGPRVFRLAAGGRRIRTLSPTRGIVQTLARKAGPTLPWSH